MYAPPMAILRFEQWFVASHGSPSLQYIAHNQIHACCMCSSGLSTSLLDHFSELHDLPCTFEPLDSPFLAFDQNTGTLPSSAVYIPPMHSGLQPIGQKDKEKTNRASLPPSWTAAPLNGEAASFSSEFQMTACPYCPTVTARGPPSSLKSKLEDFSQNSFCPHRSPLIGSSCLESRPVGAIGVKMVHSQLCQQYFDSGNLPQPIHFNFRLLLRDLKQLLHTFGSTVEATFNKRDKMGVCLPRASGPSLTF